MKVRAFIIVAVVLAALFSRVSWADSPYVGPVTVPVSSIRDSLVPSPNPIDNSGNLIVTGNVGGGKHFRGVVPYYAASDFEDETASSSLDSFLRYSAGSGNIGSYTGRYQPFYSLTGTVTAMQLGRRDVFRLPTTKIDGGIPRPDTTAILSALPEEEGLSEQYAVGQDISFRPMAATPQELMKVISNELKAYTEATKAADEQHQTQIEQYRRDFMQISKEVDELKSVLKTRDEPSQKAFTELKDLGIEQFLRVEAMEELPPASILRSKTGGEPQLPPLLSAIADKGDEQLDVYEQMRQWINTLKISTEEKELVRAEPAPPASILRSKTGGLDELSDEEISLRAKAIWGEYKSFASFSEGKFNKFMRVAEAYLKQGKYYRAADAYTLALIYKPTDPLAYAGKSHALFAAGEYMSSVLFLCRALDIFPEYARFKIDLVAMIGDRDKLESRIADVEQWVKLSPPGRTGELHFLLGYVYYQMGRLSRASEAIEAAYEKMPDIPAVNTLKRAIDAAVD